MSPAGPSAVTYVGLPIASGGAHSLGRTPRRVAYERTRAFLHTCTVPVRSPEFAFDVRDVPELPGDRRLENALHESFGGGRHVVVQEERVGDALDFLDSIDPQPTNQWGMPPIWFTWTVHFRLLDPESGQPLGGQDPARYFNAEYEFGVPLGTNGLRLILENHARVAVELCIPDPDDALLRRLVPWLQEYFPCKFSAQQWRSWTRTKTGSFRARKISTPGGDIPAVVGKPPLAAPPSTPPTRLAGAAPSAAGRDRHDRRAPT